MQRGVWLLAIGLAACACSGGYPLPPTRCDDYCDATNGMQCETYYQPAGCVSECEQAQLGFAACDAQFRALLKCFRTKPRAREQLCKYDAEPNVCAPETDALFFCVPNSPYFQ